MKTILPRASALASEHGPALLYLLAGGILAFSINIAFVHAGATDTSDGCPVGWTYNSGVCVAINPADAANGCPAGTYDLGIGGQILSGSCGGAGGIGCASGGSACVPCGATGYLIAPGACPAPAPSPSCVANQGASCSASTACTDGSQLSNTGQIQCNGTCSATAPDASLCPAPPTPTSCTPDASCAANTCTGSTCTDSCGNSYAGTQMCTLTPTPAPTVTLSATQNPIPVGSSTTKLTWSSTNADFCRGGGFAAGGVPNNSTGVSVGAGTYTIFCTGPGGSSPVESITITADTGTPGGTTPPPSGGTCTDTGTPTLTASPNLVQTNTSTSVTFTFSVPSTSGSCTLSGPGITTQTISSTASCTLSSSTYTASVTAAGQSIYTLSCPGGRTAKAIVNVTPNFKEF